MLREHSSNGTTRPPNAPNANNGESRKSSSASRLTECAASSQHLRHGHHRGPWQRQHSVGSGGWRRFGISAAARYTVLPARSHPIPQPGSKKHPGHLSLPQKLPQAALGAVGGLKGQAPGGGTDGTADVACARATPPAAGTPSTSAASDCSKNACPGGMRVMRPFPARAFCVSRMENSAEATSGSRDTSSNAAPTSCGRMAEAFANSMAARRSAVLVMMLT